mmetsp:Transcript_885/g.2469  ORF Transcript_885/g.2469 Transcript_885/m.2469 type:complete len:126 (-) Transcript_885:170-547(-)
MRMGPLSNYGWIGETSGGVCLYQGTLLRHNGATLQNLVAAAGLARFSEGKSVVVMLDHEARRLSWLVLTPSAREPAVVETALPAPLVGRRLAPLVSGTNSTKLVVRVRLEDPRCPSWRGGVASAS